MSQNNSSRAKQRKSKVISVSNSNKISKENATKSTAAAAAAAPAAAKPAPAVGRRKTARSNNVALAKACAAVVEQQPATTTAAAAPVAVTATTTKTVAAATTARTLNSSTSRSATATTASTLNPSTARSAAADNNNINNTTNNNLNLLSDVEIKQERIDDPPPQPSPTTTTEQPDIKPDINELNRELLQEPPKTLVLQPSQVLPTLFIISQLPSSCLTNNNAEALGAAVAAATQPPNASSAAGLAGQVLRLENATLPQFVAAGAATNNINTTTTAPAAGATAAATATATATATSTANPTTAAAKYFDETLTRDDELDLQESDSDEDGYSDFDFDDDDEMIEDDEEPDYYDPLWSAQPTAPRMVCKFDTPPQSIGLQGRPKSIDPSYYVNKILGFPEEFFKRVATSTNAKAQLQMGSNKGSQIYLKEISSDEIKMFIGICLQMSNMKLRTLAEYWNEQSVWGFRGFSSKMSLTRFQLILNVLSFEHLVPSQYEDYIPAVGSEDSALSGIKPLVDFFNTRMLTIYNCGQRVVLNDPILFWKGRFKWFNEVTPKFRCNAVMLHLLTEYTGLIQRLELDVERGERRVNERNSKFLVEHRVAVAKRLLAARLEKGHTVYASKYYGSYALARELVAHRTYCTGLVDEKRYGNCKELVLNRLEPNTFATKYSGSIMMGKWRNRQKNVYFFSSDCLAIYCKETSLRTIDRRPKIIKELDWQLHWKLSDEMKEQMVNYQLCLERKEIKWDKQIMIYVLNLIVFNAYVLYILHAQLGRTRFTELHLRDTTILKNYSEFRQNFILSLLNETVPVDPKTSQNSNDGESKKRKRRSLSAVAESEDEDYFDEQQPKDAGLLQNLLKVEHLPMIVPRRKGKAMKKKCRICRKGGMLTFSKLCCEICPGMPGLCETPCFKVWHEQLKKSLEAGVNIKTRIFGTSDQETIYF